MALFYDWVHDDDHIGLAAVATPWPPACQDGAHSWRWQQQRQLQQRRARGRAPAQPTEVLQRLQHLRPMRASLHPSRAVCVECLGGVRDRQRVHAARLRADGHVLHLLQIPQGGKLDRGRHPAPRTDRYDRQRVHVMPACCQAAQQDCHRESAVHALLPLRQARQHPTAAPILSPACHSPPPARDPSRRPLCLTSSLCCDDGQRLTHSAQISPRPPHGCGLPYVAHAVPSLVCLHCVSCRQVIGKAC